MFAGIFGGKFFELFVVTLTSSNTYRDTSSALRARRDEEDEWWFWFWPK
jgi:hypothetical protein